ncbi:LutC/YkgG family protein [Sulfoacidibacillus thermotolerans]|uniref:LUD domain-containing protein n=1 Tax=Sulfoacidibacillus thermotolerans TaxID=1765684 RepID=A0A2U3DBS1_SULT2|nr:LUD domain-containing protein [Sulfoacidibacillus thermotolerans]PWI58724.1 hypothetical protein BM613_01100 [Sulfoacidibacillus thermotolerans]
MNANDEATFLSNIAQRLGRNEPLQVAPKRAYRGSEGLQHSLLPSEITESNQILQKQLQGIPLSIKEQNQLADVFCKSLVEIGGHAKIITKDQVTIALQDIFLMHRPTSVLAWKDPLLDKLGIQKITQNYSLKFDVWSDSSNIDKESIAKAELGITSADYAVAETGSLVLIGSQTHGRSVSLLPATHVAFVPLSRLHLRAASVLSELRTNRMPSSVNWITGPSRTSDIEMDSTIGVHGPAHVYVFLMLDEKDDQL